MEPRELFAALPSANCDRNTLIRKAYGENAGHVILFCAIRANKGRVPTADEIAAACETIRRQVALCDEALMRTGREAVGQAGNAWLHAYWSEPREGVDETLRSKIVVAISQTVSPSQPIDRHLNDLLTEHDAWMAYGVFNAARGEWRNSEGRVAWLTAERAALASADLPDEIRADLLEAAQGDTPCVSASTEIAHWRRSIEEASVALTYKDVDGSLAGSVERAALRLESAATPEGGSIMLLTGFSLHAIASPGNTPTVMRLLDRLEVDPLAPADFATVWPGRYNMKVAWHLYVRGDRVVIAAIDPGDHAWSELLVRPGTLDDSLKWMETYRRERDARPSPLDAPSTLADTLQIRTLLKAYRAAETKCVDCWKTMNEPAATTT